MNKILVFAMILGLMLGLSGVIADETQDQDAEVPDEVVSLSISPSAVSYGVVSRENAGNYNADSETTLNTSGSSTNSDSVYVYVTIQTDTNGFFADYLYIEDNVNSGSYEDIEATEIIIPETTTIQLNTQLQIPGSDVPLQPGVKSATILYTAFVSAQP